jgi:putative membrane protein
MIFSNLMRKIKASLLLFLKGFGMGAADVVPGVSGGTIAFITGIYDELLRSIRSFDLKAIKVLFREGPISFWQHINGRFLIILLSGIAISIVSLAKLIKYLLENEPVLIWSFFFGLIIASVIYIGRQIEKWDMPNILALLIGSIIAFFITIISPATGSENLGYLFFSGMIAICAMILPGISGSFILLLIGSYSTVLGSVTGLSDALKNTESGEATLYAVNIAVFLLGCIIGIALFARVLGYVLEKHRSITIAILTGFMVGSLNKVWPWKETLQFRVNSKGEEVPFIQNNISPFNYSEIYQVDHQLMWAIVLVVIGIALVLGLEKIGNTSNN